MAAAVTLLSAEDILVLQNSTICMQKYTLKRSGCEKRGEVRILIPEDRHKLSTSMVALTLSYPHTGINTTGSKQV